MLVIPYLALIALFALRGECQCPDYAQFSKERHEPFSTGRFKLAFQRPNRGCRTFNSSVVEERIGEVKDRIADPDLARLFENSYPNTLDTAIKWKGFAKGSDEELTFIITGDINAMWLRDSSNQLQSYLPLLTPSSSTNSLASLFRGAINLQARYLIQSPFCNSFQPPVESGIPPETNGAGPNDQVYPAYDRQFVFECKYEIDSLAAFLQASVDYYTATKDADFFGKYQWIKGIESVLKAAESMMISSYGEDGSVNPSPYSFRRVWCELTNNGLSAPANNGTGLIRSGFRPSDDPTLYQFFIPGNMMFSSYLREAAKIMAQLDEPELTARMKKLSSNLDDAIREHGIVNHPKFGPIYAFEIDGFGSSNFMDDANIPSLLSAPLSGYLDRTNKVYQNTRKFVLSRSNPYFMQGPVISAIGGPHVGLGAAWPMASIVRILTSDDEDEIIDQLKQILRSTDGLGLIHESVKANNVKDWTRQW